MTCCGGKASEERSDEETTGIGICERRFFAGVPESFVHGHVLGNVIRWKAYDLNRSEWLAMKRMNFHQGKNKEFHACYSQDAGGNAYGTFSVSGSSADAAKRKQPPAAALVGLSAASSEVLPDAP